MQIKSFFASTAALVGIIVVGSTGAAVAGSLIDGGDVQNGSLSGADIKSESITGADIDNGTITGNDIRNETVGTVDIATGGVATSEIRDGSILWSDLSLDASTNLVAEAKEEFGAPADVQDTEDSVDGTIGSIGAGEGEAVAVFTYTGTEQAEDVKVTVRNVGNVVIGECIAVASDFDGSTCSFTSVITLGSGVTMTAVTPSGSNVGGNLNAVPVKIN